MHVLRGETAVGERAVEVEVRVQLVVRKVAPGADVMDENLVGLAEVLIDANDALVGRETALSDTGIVDHTGGVGQRHVLIDQ